MTKILIEVTPDFIMAAPYYELRSQNREKKTKPTEIGSCVIENSGFDLNNFVVNGVAKSEVGNGNKREQCGPKSTACSEETTTSRQDECIMSRRYGRGPVLRQMLILRRCRRIIYAYWLVVDSVTFLASLTNKSRHLVLVGSKRGHEERGC